MRQSNIFSLEDFLIVRESNIMKRELSLIFGAIIGIFGTIGGWYMFLLMFNLVPELEYGPISLLILFCGVTTVLGAQLFGGLWFLWDSIVVYRDCDNEAIENKPLFVEDDEPFILEFLKDDMIRLRDNGLLPNSIAIANKWLEVIEQIRQFKTVDGIQFGILMRLINDELKKKLEAKGWVQVN